MRVLPRGDVVTRCTAKIVPQVRPDTNHSNCRHEWIGDMCMRGETGCSSRMEGAGNAAEAIARLLRGETS